MEKYKILDHLTSGAHGVVLEAVLRRKKSVTESSDKRKDRLAIKRILLRNPRSLPVAVTREIESLQLLKGQTFIVQLLDVCRTSDSVHLVFPLLPSNLTHLIHQCQMDAYQKIAVTFMMLQGIRILHSKNLMHRDLKPSNLLIDWDGCLKICDFGQARLLHPDRLHSHQVSTRSYRSPELLYGATSYGQETDMWSAGCIIAEVYMKNILFMSQSDISQLSAVISSLGHPPVEWASAFPDYGKITFDFGEDLLKQNKKKFRSTIKESVDNESVCDLIFSLVRYTNRESADYLLKSAVFREMREKGIRYDLLIRPSVVKHPVGPHMS